MSRDFTFEPEIAQQTEYHLRYIEEPGVYKGTFSAAWYEQSQSGAECIKLRFVADNGSQANNLSVYTHGRNGQRLSGYLLIQKIMVCMKIKALKSRPDNVDIFDYHSRQMTQQKRDIYPDLCGPIGLVLTTEEYESKYAIKTQVIIHAAFDPHTRLMADEILKGIEKPAALDKLIAHLDAKNQWQQTLKVGHNSAPTSAPKQTQQPAQNQRQTSTQNDDPFEEDHVPF